MYRQWNTYCELCYCYYIGLSRVHNTFVIDGYISVSLWTAMRKLQINLVLRTMLAFQGLERWCLHTRLTNTKAQGQLWWRGGVGGIYHVQFKSGTRVWLHLCQSTYTTMNGWVKAMHGAWNNWDFMSCLTFRWRIIKLFPLVLIYIVIWNAVKGEWLAYPTLVQQAGVKVLAVLHG